MSIGKTIDNVEILAVNKTVVPGGH